MTDRNRIFNSDWKFIRDSLIGAEAQGFDVQDAGVFSEKRVHQWMLERIADRLKNFPGYANVHAVSLLTEPWTIDDGTMTPTMKLRRACIIEQNQAAIEKMYEGH